MPMEEQPSGGRQSAGESSAVARHVLAIRVSCGLIGLFLAWQFFLAPLLRSHPVRESGAEHGRTPAGMSTAQPAVLPTDDADTGPPCNGFRDLTWGTVLPGRQDMVRTRERAPEAYGIDQKFCDEWRRLREKSISGVPDLAIRYLTCKGRLCRIRLSTKSHETDLFAPFRAKYGGLNGCPTFADRSPGTVELKRLPDGRSEVILCHERWTSWIEQDFQREIKAEERDATARRKKLAEQI